MPQGLSPCWDTGLDSEPLLFDEEFCESVLKDLEMVPTPPHSPDIKSGFCSPLSGLFNSSTDQLEFVTGLLLDDGDNDCAWGPGSNPDKAPDYDCIWESFPTLDDLEKVMNEKLCSVMSSSPLLADIETGIYEDIEAHHLDCKEHFTCPQPEQTVQLEQSSSEDEMSVSTGSVTSSSSDSGEQNEEEIDVVTVERQKATVGKGVRFEQSRRTETRSQKLAAIKRCNLEIQLQHNYAAPFPTHLESVQPQQKRLRTEHSSNFKHVSKNRSPCLKSSSDREEEERRRTHNVLERQRRNELKICFLKLRDEVPDLLNKEKASKVVILQQARDYIRFLQCEEQKFLSSTEKLSRKREQLKRKLEYLKRTK